MNTTPQSVITKPDFKEKALEINYIECIFSNSYLQSNTKTLLKNQQLNPTQFLLKEFSNKKLDEIEDFLTILQTLKEGSWQNYKKLNNQNEFLRIKFLQKTDNLDKINCINLENIPIYFVTTSKDQPLVLKYEKNLKKIDNGHIFAFFNADDANEFLTTCNKETRNSTRIITDKIFDYFNPFQKKSDTVQINKINSFEQPKSSLKEQKRTFDIFSSNLSELFTILKTQSNKITLIPSSDNFGSLIYYTEISNFSNINHQGFSERVFLTSFSKKKLNDALTALDPLSKRKNIKVKATEEFFALTKHNENTLMEQNFYFFLPHTSFDKPINEDDIRKGLNQKQNEDQKINKFSSRLEKMIKPIGHKYVFKSKSREAYFKNRNKNLKRHRKRSRFKTYLRQYFSKWNPSEKYESLQNMFYNENYMRRKAELSLEKDIKDHVNKYQTERSKLKFDRKRKFVKKAKNYRYDTLLNFQKKKNKNQPLLVFDHPDLVKLKKFDKKRKGWNLKRLGFKNGIFRSRFGVPLKSNKSLLTPRFLTKVRFFSNDLWTTTPISNKLSLGQFFKTKGYLKNLNEREELITSNIEYPNNAHYPLELDEITDDAAYNSNKHKIS